MYICFYFVFGLIIKSNAMHISISTVSVFDISIRGICILWEHSKCWLKFDVYIPNIYKCIAYAYAIDEDDIDFMQMRVQFSSNELVGWYTVHSVKFALKMNSVNCQSYLLNICISICALCHTTTNNNNYINRFYSRLAISIQMPVCAMFLILWIEINKRNRQII